MSQEARVDSILVLKQLRASLGTFAEIASAALDETSTEIQRTSRWLREDRYRHWRTQVQARTERFVRAKLALKQKQVFDRTLSGTPSSCVDEKKALKVAEERLREAEHKFSRVKAWSRQIEQELSDYRGATHGLINAIEAEIPNARARLDKMIESLEAYFALVPPEMPGSAAGESEVDLGQRGEVSPEPPAEQQSPAPQGSEEGVEASQETTPSPPESSAS